MAEDLRIIVVDDFEHRLMVNCLNDTRNSLIQKELPHEDLDNLMLKIIDARFKKERRKLGRDER